MDAKSWFVSAHHHHQHWEEVHSYWKKYVLLFPGISQLVTYVLEELISGFWEYFNRWVKSNRLLKYIHYIDVLACCKWYFAYILCDSSAECLNLYRPRFLWVQTFNFPSYSAIFCSLFATMSKNLWLLYIKMYMIYYLRKFCDMCLDLQSVWWSEIPGAYIVSKYRQK